MNNYQVHFKIGDKAWCIRLYHSKRCASKGIIDHIYFDKDMDVVYVVRGIGRGKYGTKIFKTKEEAEAMIAKSFGEAI